MSSIGKNIAMFGNLALFIETMIRFDVSKRYSLPFIGIDESLNHPQIHELTRKFVRKGLIDCSDSLWFERWGGGFVGGGISRSSMLHDRKHPMFIGKRLEKTSWSDYEVVQMLVVRLQQFDKVILLSKDKNENEDGLRAILDTMVCPALDKRNDNLSLVGLFMGVGKNIDDYCNQVEQFVAQALYKVGYEYKEI